MSDKENKLAPLNVKARESSLHYLLHKCPGMPFTTATELLTEFEHGVFEGNGTGTRLLLWNLRPDVALPKTVADIRWKGAEGAPAGATSLRAYIEVLYLHMPSKDIIPSIRIVLRGTPVLFRNWDKYLLELRKSYALPRPQRSDVSRQFESGEQQLAAQAGNEASLTVGYARTMASLHAVLNARNTSADIQRAKKDVLALETGFCVYHKGRLTRCLENINMKGASNNAMETAMKRITVNGHGLTGFIQENYLVQHNNKAVYVDAGLYSTLLSHAREKCRNHLRVYSMPKLAEAMGHIPPNMRSSGSKTSGNIGSKVASGKSASGQATAPPKSGGKVVELNEEMRMRPRDRNDTIVGRVVKVERNRYDQHVLHAHAAEQR